MPFAPPAHRVLPRLNDEEFQAKRDEFYNEIADLFARHAGEDLRENLPVCLCDALAMAIGRLGGIMLRTNVRDPLERSRYAQELADYYSNSMRACLEHEISDHRDETAKRQ